MSVISNAKSEMKLAGFEQEDIDTMSDILTTFFKRWDSGGAVWAMAPVLMKCVANKPLTPLSGNDDEWVEVADGIKQNKRCSSVFIDPRFHDGKKAYDLDNPAGSREAIEFPYWPQGSQVSSPVFTAE